MPEPATPLGNLQCWMLEVVTNPGGVDAGLRDAQAHLPAVACAAELERVVQPSSRQTAGQRLEIYHRAYFARLLEVLRAEYSVLCRALGQELFDAFASGYLQAYPPVSYTLADLGKHFPEFLCDLRRARREEAAPPDWPEFMVDLARLEKTVNEVFDGPGSEGRPALCAATLRQLSLDQWLTARLVLAPHVRLLKLDFAVNECFTSLLRGENCHLPDPGPAYLAVSRKEFRVARRNLAEAAYRLLQALAAGQPVGQCLARAAASQPTAGEPLAQALSCWFAEWTDAGFFSDLVLSD